MRAAYVIAALAAMWVQPASAVSLLTETLSFDNAGNAVLAFNDPLPGYFNLNGSFKAYSVSGPVPTSLESDFTRTVTLCSNFNNCAATGVTQVFHETDGSNFTPYAYSGRDYDYARIVVPGSLYEYTMNVYTGSRLKFAGLPNSTFSFTVNFQTVPEPSTWAMMILGVGFVGRALRRRRQMPLTLASREPVKA